MTGTLNVLRSGEPVRTWDTDDLKSVAKVREAFDQIVKGQKGSALSEGERLTEFDETKPEITVIPQYAGG